MKQPDPGATGGDAFTRYLRWHAALDDPFVEVDLGHAGLEDRAFDVLAPRLRTAIAAMEALENGAIANPDEGRRVGHYWLRAPGLAPDHDTSVAIEHAIARVVEFAGGVRDGRIAPPGRAAFRRVCLIGIGGSALGPMLVADALDTGSGAAPRALVVLDNTDPDGIDRELRRLGDLGDVLFVVASKSGGTPETRNGMLEAAHACRAQGLELARQAVAITADGSALDRRAVAEGWLARFPMWDWVGGRTSVCSAVGLLPLALLGHDVRGFLAGAAAMDARTREREPRANPAALLAAWWHVAGQGRGARDLVVLPYKDRLALLARYLQQLVMESLGKELDRSGRRVLQGLSVYGNKGSTDQHAYVQQLRDGLDNFFVLFVRVLTGRDGPSVEVEPGVTSGDFLDGFWLGTRAALAERGRRSATITLGSLGARSLGAVIALFERTVGLYAELIDVNAYHQPGVEAGKRAAQSVLELQARVVAAVDDTPRSAAAIAARLSADAELVWQILRRLARGASGVLQLGGAHAAEARFRRAE